MENILREPLTPARVMLNNMLREARDPQTPTPFTFDDFQDFVKGIPSSSIEFQQEALNVQEAVLTGKAPQAPKFALPETQLLWGAALGYLSVNPDVMRLWDPPAADDATLRDTGLWKQVTQTKHAIGELLSHATHIEEALRDSKKYGWSDPGTGFEYDRQKNRINIDLAQSLIIGFEHARSDAYREIGHALLSITYPKRMRDVYKDMQPLMKKARLAQDKKGPQLKPEEYKQLRLLSAEWELRHMMFASAEENVANRFVANIGQQMLQDYGVSINNTAVTSRFVGLMALPSAEEASPELIRYMNLCNAVHLSFFVNNNLFDNTDASWRAAGVEPNLVRTLQTQATEAPDTQGVSHPDFIQLRDMCGGPKGLEHLQPKQNERLYGGQKLRIEAADAARNTVVENIWSLYAEDLIQKILQNVNDQVEQQMKQQQQQGQGQDQEQDGQEQEGQEQEGQGSGQGKGKPQKGKKGKSQKGRGQPQGSPQSSEDSDGDSGEESDQSADQQADQDGSGNEQKDQGQGEKQKSKSADGDLGADKEEDVPVEGAGKMPAPNKSLEKPSDEVDPSADGQDGEENDGAESDADAKSSQQLQYDLDKADQQDGQAQDGQDADADADGQGKAGKQKSGKSKKTSQQAGHGNGTPLGDLAKQDWTDYSRRVAELAGPISRVRKLFKAIQERQLQRKRDVSTALDILPENGEVKDRFNFEAHRAMTIKKETGQLEESDLKRFHKDTVKLTPASIDIFIMIDGSGSMGSGSPSPLDSALQASAIMYEAAAGKDMNMNVYVGMWGTNNPPIIIKPGDDRVTIGKAMQAARNGLNSGTDFAPSVQKVAQTVAEQRGKSGVLSGFTHVLVISDGDIFDADQAKQKIKTMFDHSDKVTFDAAIIAGRPGSGMEQMSRQVKGNKPFQEVGVVLNRNPETVPLAIVGLLLEKIRKCGSFMAVPNSHKRRQMQKALNKMGS